MSARRTFSRRSAIQKKSAVSVNHGHGLAPYINRYLQAGQIQHVSPDTTRRRKNALTRFMDWCNERGIEDPRMITKPMLERYQRYLYYYRKENGEPLSIGSQNVMLTPIRSFFKWLTQENYLLYNPASELVLPKKPKHLPRYILSVDEVERVLQQPDIQTPTGLRDRAMMEVLYATGVRRIELVNLEESSIDYQRQTLLVREGKGRKDRYVPLTERALQWLDRYRCSARPELQVDYHCPVLFLTHRGQPFSRSALGARVKTHLSAAGIEAAGSCHLFRHAIATHMLENGADIRYIQALLGHDDLTSTEVYTRVSIEKLQAIHQATHPLA